MCGGGGDSTDRCLFACRCPDSGYRRLLHYAGLFNTIFRSTKSGAMGCRSIAEQGKPRALIFVTLLGQVHGLLTAWTVSRLLSKERMPVTLGVRDGTVSMQLRMSSRYIRRMTVQRKGIPGRSRMVNQSCYRFLQRSLSQQCSTPK